MSDEHSSVYVDRPKPSRGYLTGIAGIVLAMLAVAAIIGAESFRQHDPTVNRFLMLFIVTGGVIVGLFLHAAYHTEYAIDERALHLKWGILQNHSIRLNDVRSLEHVDFFQGVLALNRLTNLIRIRLSGEIRFSRGVAVSPSDIDEFVQELEARAGRKLLR